MAVRVLSRDRFNPVYVDLGSPGQGDFSVIRAEIDYANHYLDWDGFGFNYVQTTMTADYDQWAQEYGGFSIMSEETRQEILELVFGEDGLKPGVMKLFLDPLHQEEPGGAFDHEKTTRWMLEFAERGLEMTRARAGPANDDHAYGLPDGPRKQGEIRGRDLDPEQEGDCRGVPGGLGCLP